MKNSVVIALVALFMFSCSSENVNNSEDLNTANLSLGADGKFQTANCTFAAAINESGVVIPGGVPQYSFSWNNTFPYLDCDNYTTEIEFFNDNMTNPNTGATYPNGNPNGDGYCSNGDVDDAVSIDFWGTNSFTIAMQNNGVFDSKCIWWRIVIKGTRCPNTSQECETATPWHFLQVP